jgi:carboxymethylenebutenolidase
MHPETTAFLVPPAFNRRRFLVTSLASGFALAVQPVRADTVVHTDETGLLAGEVKVPVADGEMVAYRAQPAGAKNLPTVLVVQEIFGVHEHIRDICRRLAKLGYLAIAPALFARQGDVSQIADVQKIVSDVVSKVPDEQVMNDLDATALWAALNGGNAEKLAITGFCWGGRIVWLYAEHNPNLKAGVAWYGGLERPGTLLQPKNPIDLVDQMTAPVLGLYGGADTGITLDTVQHMISALAASPNAYAKASQITLYPDTPHGFNADYRPSYREAQAKDGWAKLLLWFKHYGVV